MRSPAYSVVVPAYNEGPRITATLNRVLEYLTSEHWDAELLVVNDGSRDNTASIVAAVSQRDPRVHLLENPGNRGKGYSVRHGMQEARGEILLFSDADLSSPIEEAAKLVAALRAGAEVAIGSRWLRPELMIERQPLLRQVYGRLFNAALRIILGLNFKDTQCGLKAFTRRAAQEIFARQHIERWGFDAELLFVARRFGFKTVEIPVAWAHDDRSKINPLRDGIRMAGETLLIRWLSLTGRYNQPFNRASPCETVPAGQNATSKSDPSPR